MSQYTKQILFMVAGLILLALIGLWNTVAQNLLAFFGFGWMLSDISRTLFPENSKK